MPHSGTTVRTHTSAMRWFLFLATLVLVDAGLVQTYCSNQNTGSGSNAMSSPYQSNGQCTTNCANYAFAVVQGLNCWCSNFAPYNQIPISNCASTCPGYPSELCGNTDRGLFGYVALGGKRASGTIGAPAATTQAAPPPSTIVTSQTIISSIFVATTITDNPAPAPSSTEEPTTSTTPPASTTAPPTIVVTTIVNSVGSVITVTSTPSLSANSELTQKSSSNGVSPGVVAAIVVVIVVALAVIIGALLFMLARRKKANKQLMQENESIQGVARMNSQMSKNGLLAGGAPLFAAGAGSAHPDSAGSAGGLSRRDSRPMFYDQRLNPNVIMMHPDQSRNSVNTIDDHRDYGRKLNVTNPDADRD